MLLNFSVQAPKFNLTILRKGTAFGYSPRMRFDLVVNSMYRSIVESQSIEVHHGGNMWRPLVSVETICNAYIKMIESHDTADIVNVSSGNIKIIDLAKMIKSISPKTIGIDPDLTIISGDIGNTRSYKVDASLLEQQYEMDVPGLETSICDEFQKMRNFEYDFDDKRYYNIEIMDGIDELQGN